MRLGLGLGNYPGVDTALDCDRLHINIYILAEVDKHEKYSFDQRSRGYAPRE